MVPLRRCAEVEKVNKQVLEYPSTVFIAYKTQGDAALFASELRRLAKSTISACAASG